MLITTCRVIKRNDANPNVENVVCGSQKEVDLPVKAVNVFKSIFSIYSSSR